MKFHTKKNKIYISILICILLSSCTEKTDLPYVPSLSIDESQINSEVIVYDPVGWNSYVIGEPIYLMIEVIGINQIIFPKDYGIKVFRKSDYAWINTDISQINIISEDIILKPSDGTQKYLGSTIVLPLIENSNPTNLRILIQGNKYNHQNIIGSRVAAYTDVILYPRE